MLHTYSPSLKEFVCRLEQLIKKSLWEDFRVEVLRKRFLYQTCYYPINIVIFEGSREIGYFNATYHELGFHRRLQFATNEDLLNVIRHELLHYFTYIHFGTKIAPHGSEFKQKAKDYNLSADVISPRMEWPETLIENENQHNRILEKVKKLLALAESSNCHEKETASLKAHQLLLKHKLSEQDLQDKAEEYYSKKILKRKKKDAELTTISRILRQFYIYPIIVQGRGETSLEIFGEKNHVELADYLATYLQKLLSQHWLEAKKNKGWLGLRMKNSFYFGVGEGFVEKMERSSKDFSNDEQKSLITLDKKITQMAYVYFPHLSSSTSQRSINTDAKAAGMRVGKNLEIRSGLKSSQKEILQLN